jgi:hypothetical protein
MDAGRMARIVLALSVLTWAVPGVANAGVAFDGYPAPQGASPLRVPLVPAFKPCITYNIYHGPPLAYPSCSPPVGASESLTVGTPDNNSAQANSIGSVRLNVVAGAVGPPDDSDVVVAMSLTDVRCKPGVTACGSSNTFDGPDYTGEVKVQWIVRITDRFNAAAPGGGPDPATMVEIPFAITDEPSCSATASTSIGATCAFTTTFNANVPGSVKDARRAIWQLDQTQVFDGGTDGQGGTDPNTLFAVQGVFVP